MYLITLIRQIICFLLAILFNYQCSNNGCPYYLSGDSCQDECGITFVEQNQKIVGGEVANPFSWPAQIFLRLDYSADYFNPRTNRVEKYDHDSFCGGTLIDRNTVLTAAHCVTDLDLYVPFLNDYRPLILNSYYPTTESLFTVFAGIHDISNVSRQDGIKVAKVIFHKDYNPSTFANDMAIIKLEKPVELSERVQIACLPDPKYDIYPDNIDAPVWAVGWGAVGERQQISNLLKNVKLDQYNFAVCKIDGLDSDEGLDKNAVICAGEVKGGKDTCQGDSGGPLYYRTLVNGKPKYVTVGVVSHGDGCAKRGTAGLYMRNSFYKNWIAENRK